VTQKPVSSRQQDKATAKRKHKHVKVKVPHRLSTVRAPAADLDVSNLTLNSKPVSAKLRQAITDGSLDQTIQGASTFALTVEDWYEGLLHSRLVAGASTLAFDGISFTLVKTSRQGTAMTLTFEETAVNLLRQYTKAKKAARDGTTRAQFVQSMVREVKEATIPFKCPEVNIVQPVAKSKVQATPAGKSSHRTKGKGLLSSSTASSSSGLKTTGATWFSDCQGAYGDLCDGGYYYAELGQAGANAYMGGLLGKLFGRSGPLPAGTKLQIQFGGKTLTASKKDVGSGQGGDSHYAIDIHQHAAQALGFISAGRADVKVRLV
jgi:hypothetical protein